jgi:hypothetical protein
MALLASIKDSEIGKIQMIVRISHYLQKHPFQRHLVFLGLALLAIAVNGYHFGTFDQVFHLTFLKKFVSPELYPNDVFLNLRWYHFSYFWFLFIPLFKIGLLEIGMFFVHVLTVYGTLWMFWELSNLLFKNQTANLLIVLALVFPHLGFPGFQIIEFSLLNRTFVLPFLLGSIWLYLKNKKIWAFLLLGLMFNLHVIYAVFVLCMFLLDEAIRFQFKFWKKPVLQIIIFMIAGLPVLIWRMGTGDGIDLTLRPEMLDLAARGLLFTVYFPVSTIPHVIGNLIAGIATAWGFILGYHHLPNNEQHRTMRNFVYAIAVLIAVGTLASYLLPITIILQMQILRAGVFLLYFGMLYLSGFIGEQYRQHRLKTSGFLLISLSFILFITPLFTILLWHLLKLLNRSRFSPAWLIPVVIIIQAVTVLAASQTGLWEPGWHIYGPQSPWRDVQEWARARTPLDSRFISPPHIFWHYTPDWRVFSERASVVTIPEIMELPFDPGFAASFQERFEAVAPGAIDAFNGDYMRSLEITEKAFYTNSEINFEELGCRFSADYLVVEREHPYNLTMVYQNEGFIVYQLPGCE